MHTSLFDTLVVLNRATRPVPQFTTLPGRIACQVKHRGLREPRLERTTSASLSNKILVLTAEVEGLQDGAVKESLRASLCELQAIADDMKPHGESTA